MCRRFFATLCALLVAGAAAGAPAGQDLAQLRERAQRFVDAEAVRHRLPAQRVGPPDARVFLPACDALETAWPDGRPAGQVAVRCPSLGWSLGLPVEAARVARRVFVASGLIATGQVLTAADIKLADVGNATLARQGVDDASLLLGKAARAQIPPGTVLRPTALRAPFVVRMRAPVRALVEYGGVRVAADGVANNNAAAGESVAVRMPSGRVVQGVARDDGSVVVNVR
ncbi:flagellar basal body P-ring formation chaperone FlgA [Crenobacter caeni]|uniref:Flagella basal body P-ring formation protein FlgA n=1 Tax=Crenobacter caeni TaxID=2705474 RepID=A0A6B2KW47_9NEIS|nr:flagellar basal body P-ring formation chaperone FlgA [Crenobacter caeni]NDV14217.1 flagellar basal body P-ring formation protein FlgA [Crenobacter caeni]